jgi:hypothetical protein
VSKPGKGWEGAPSEQGMEGGIFEGQSQVDVAKGEDPFVKLGIVLMTATQQ